MKSELNTHETVSYVAAKGTKERQKKYLEGMPPEYMDFVNKVELMLAKYNSEKKKQHSIEKNLEFLTL